MPVLKICKETIAGQSLQFTGYYDAINDVFVKLYSYFSRINFYYWHGIFRALHPMQRPRLWLPWAKNPRGCYHALSEPFCHHGRACTILEDFSNHKIKQGRLYDP